jgi:hypothetical protein
MTGMRVLIVEDDEMIAQGLQTAPPAHAGGDRRC